MLYVNPVGPLLNRTGGMTGADTAAQRKQALQEFERLYLYSLLREMHQSTTVAGDKKGREMQLFEEMLHDALAGEMARSGQVGIARQIEQQLTRQNASDSLKPAANVGPNSNSDRLNPGPETRATVTANGGPNSNSDLPALLPTVSNSTCR